MIETLIQLKPQDQWREGMTIDTLIAELDRTVKFPGVTNAWVMPIKTRIDMLATGIKTPVGVKVSGEDLEVIETIGREVEKAVMQVPGTQSAYSERVTGGRYIEITPDRLAAARLGLNITDINQIVSAAVGGMNISETIEGLERYPINLRFPRETRDSLEKLRELPIVTPAGAQVTLAQIAEVKIVDGAPMLKSENARLNGWTFVDIRGVDIGSYVKQAQAVVAEQVKLPPGYSITWSGQYEYMLRAQAKLNKVVPLTLVIIFLLLYLTFRNIPEALLVMLSLPFALVGGFWLIFLLGYNLSVAVGVGFIALAGVAAEFGVVMLVYLDNAWKERKAAMQDSVDRYSHTEHGNALGIKSCDYGRCGHARTPQSHDCCRDYCRSDSDHAGTRHRLGGDATHRCTDGGRYDYCPVVILVCDSSDLFLDASQSRLKQSPSAQLPAYSSWRLRSCW